MEIEILEMSIKDKERCLNEVLIAMPGIDSMIVQDVLLKYNWDAKKSIEELRKKLSNKRPYETENNGEIHKKPKKYRKESTMIDSEDDMYGKEKVFDSEDSDDYTESKTIQRQEVYNFFNNANIGELTSVKTCSMKKAELILENRPFRSWEELVTKFNSQKSLATELLNHCQEYLDKRSTLVKLIAKCKKIVERLENAVSEGAGITLQPVSINPEMKLADYQIVGLNWLAVLHQNETNGILADEMGLGKTVQIIAFLAYLKETQQQENPHVIVVPSSTLDNWGNELSKWCPSLNVARYYGSQEERRIMRIQWAKEGLEDVDVILTTYHIISSSNEDKKLFRVRSFHYVIFDEAHMLKNMLTLRYSTLLRVNASRRILLTGTPLQNNLLELISLLCFVMPSLFHNKTDDIKVLFSKKTAKVEDGADGDSRFDRSQIDKAKNIMKPFILRRLKKDVLSFLPKKSESVVMVPITADQKKHYQDLVDEYKNIDISSYAGAGMTIMMDMRKLANHPLLLRFYFTDSHLHDVAKVLAKDTTYKNNSPKEIFEDIAPLSDLKINQLAIKYPSIKTMVKIPDENILNSGKFRKLDKLLPELKKDGHRVLIFSQFVMMLDLIEMYLAIRNHKCVRLDGSTAVTDRQDLIEEYTENQDIFVFLLSTKAGGLGINLTSADRAIIHDIDFNPYNDKQAEDRCHRIGQTKDVVIYKFIAEGTIEEGMNLIAQEKLKLEKEVTSDEVGNQENHKSMVKLMKMSLGLNENMAEVLLSPVKKSNNVEDDF